MQQKRGFGRWAAWAAMCVVPALIGGCSGTTNGVGGFGNPTQTGTFTGASANLGAGRAGTFALSTFSNNTVTGTLTVTAPAALVKKSTTSNALVTLPTGVYNFSGTRTANSFTGTGTIPGTNNSFTVSGTLSTTATAGGFTITGSLNGEPFEFNGTIAVSAGGGGGGGGGNNGSFTFSGNNSNANAAAFSAIAGGGTLININNERLLSATFASATSPTNLRNVTITVTKSSALAADDTFTLTDDEDPNAGQSVVIYGEGAPTNKAWISKSGQVKITAINGGTYTLQLINARLEPAAIAGPGQTNQATGEFTLNGSGTATIVGQ